MVPLPTAREMGPLSLTRRSLLIAAGTGSLGAMLSGPAAMAGDDDESPAAFVARMTGKTAVESDRVHLKMPKTFPTGYTVPLWLAVDTPMTAADHVKQVAVFAPRNPIVEIVSFRFIPGRSDASVSTRVRLAEPQYVIATAEMGDGALLMAKTWVSVATNGCA